MKVRNTSRKGAGRGRGRGKRVKASAPPDEEGATPSASLLSTIKLYCLKCEEEVSTALDDSRPQNKNNELKRVCAHCERTDQNFLRNTKNNADKRLEWKN